MKNESQEIALEAACEISVLASALIDGADRVTDHAILGRGIAVRISQLAAIVIEAISDGDDQDVVARLEKRLKGR